MPVFILGMFLFVSAAYLGWIKLRYGFNFTDEGYLATESWRLAAGDHFLDDKLTGALRHYTLINSFLFKIYPDISMLQMRQLQFILTLAALLIFSISLFRQNRQYAWLPFVFSLFAFTGLDPVGLISNLYYQTYPHLFLILYISLMLFGFQSGNPAIKKILYLLSGLCLWLMTLSLLYMGIIVFAPIIIFVLSRNFKLKDYPFTFRDLLYVLTPFVVCWMLFIAIFNKPYVLNIFNSLNVIHTIPYYSTGLITANWGQIKRIMISAIFLLLFFAAIKKLPARLFIASCAILSVIIYLMINTPLFNFLTTYYNGWFARPMWFSSLLMAFTILFWMHTIRKYILKKTFSNEEGLSIILMAPFTISAYTMNIFSGLGPMAVCQTAIPAVAAIYLFFASNIDKAVKSPKFVTPAKAGVQNMLKSLDSGFRRNDGQRYFPAFYESVNISHPKFRQTISIIIVALLLGPFYYTTARHDWDFTFYDVVPKYANVRIETGFGRGIYTNQIYSKIYDWLIANATYFTQPDDYAISYIVSPMVHMITKLRPSLDDTFIFFEKPNSYFKKCIEKMEQRGREPKIAFIFERWPIIVGGAEIFRAKELDFPSSRDPISIYIKTHMTPVSTFKISDDHIIRCYVDYNLARDRKAGKLP